MCRKRFLSFFGVLVLCATAHGAGIIPPRGGGGAVNLTGVNDGSGTGVLANMLSVQAETLESERLTNSILRAEATKGNYASRQVWPMRYWWGRVGDVLLGGTNNYMPMVIIGDSIAGTYVRSSTNLFYKLWSAYGFGGYSGFNFSWQTYGLNGSATLLTRNTAPADSVYNLSPYGLAYRIPSGSSVTFNPGRAMYDLGSTSPRPLNYDTFEMYYCVTNGGGSFSVAANRLGSTNEWIVLSSVSTDNGGSVAGAVTNVTMPSADLWVFTVTASGADVYMCQPAFKNSGTKGLVIYELHNGGELMADQVTTSTNIVWPWVAAIAPKLFVQSDVGISSITEIEARRTQWQLGTIGCSELVLVPNLMGSLPSFDASLEHQMWEDYALAHDNVAIINPAFMMDNYAGMLDVGWFTLSDSTHSIKASPWLVADTALDELGMWNTISASTKNVQADLINARRILYNGQDLLGAYRRDAYGRQQNGMFLTNGAYAYSAISEGAWTSNVWISLTVDPITVNNAYKGVGRISASSGMVLNVDFQWSASSALTSVQVQLRSGSDNRTWSIATTSLTNYHGWLPGNPLHISACRIVDNINADSNVDGDMKVWINGIRAGSVSVSATASPPAITNSITPNGFAAGLGNNPAQPGVYSSFVAGINEPLTDADALGLYYGIVPGHADFEYDFSRGGGTRIPEVRWRRLSGFTKTYNFVVVEGTATPTQYGFMAQNPHIVAGKGTPEAYVTAPIGTLYLRTDGSAGTTLYIKESGTGNTGWVAK